MTIPDWIDRNEYPFTPKEFKLPMGTMRYVDEGPHLEHIEGKGDPIVFVLGNPSWSFGARDAIKLLSPQYRCIAVDHLGLGLSDKPTDFSYLPQDHAKNFEAFLEALGLENITFVVGDWGGPISLSYTIRHPEKVKAVVITNTWFWSVRKNWRFTGFSKIMGGPIGRWLTRHFNFFAYSFVKIMYGDKSKLTPAVHKHYLRQTSTPDERKAQWVFPEQILGASDWLDELWSQRDVLQDKIKLIAWGMKDIAFQTHELKHWIKHFPDVKVLRYAGAGHFLAEEEPEALIEEITALL